MLLLHTPIVFLCFRSEATTAVDSSRVLLFKERRFSCGSAGTDYEGPNKYMLQSPRESTNPAHYATPESYLPPKCTHGAF